jgi:acyl dehydratase
VGTVSEHELVMTPPADAAVRYAEASGDMNPIHTDAEAAREAGLPGPILHGLYTMAQVARAAAASAGTGAFGVRRLSVDFRAVAFPEEELRIAARPAGERDGRAVVALSARQSGRRVVRNAEAEVETAREVDAAA